ncbi:MAG TPA: DUF3052 domain-containing protein [Acidimicrobiia bacterium]|jgi:hypothetical protein
MTGYSGTPLPQKLGIKEGMTVGILNLPNYYDFDLGDLPDDVEVHRTDRPADVFIVFAERSDEAERGFQLAITLVPADGAIWVFWPKRSSGVETDLTENTLRELFLPTGMVDNKVIAVDETWSGLRFVVRKENRAGWPPVS